MNSTTTTTTTSTTVIVPAPSLPSLLPLALAATPTVVVDVVVTDWTQPSGMRVDTGDVIAVFVAVVVMVLWEHASNPDGQPLAPGGAKGTHSCWLF